MILEIVDPVERERVFERARMFSGSDEQHLSSEWLARPDVYCVAQLNDVHATHYEADSLIDSFAIFPEESWFLVALGNSSLRCPSAITAPDKYLLSGEKMFELPDYWMFSPFLLFNADHDAAILYSQNYEYRLIAGEAKFVQAYIEGSPVDPIQELRQWFQGNMDWNKKEGHAESAAAIQRTLEVALSQVKLPPPLNDPT